MKKIEFNHIEYELLENYGNCFNEDELQDKITDYFENFDYIFGDFAYDKVRLKGFYESSNKNVTAVNDIKYLDSYIKDYCAYGASYFLLKKIK